MCTQCRTLNCPVTCRTEPRISHSPRLSKLMKKDADRLISRDYTLSDIERRGEARRRVAPGVLERRFGIGCRATCVIRAIYLILFAVSTLYPQREILQIWLSAYLHELKDIEKRRHLSHTQPLLKPIWDNKNVVLTRIMVEGLCKSRASGFPHKPYPTWTIAFVEWLTMASTIYRGFSVVV